MTGRQLAQPGIVRPLAAALVAISVAVSPLAHAGENRPASASTVTEATSPLVSLDGALRRTVAAHPATVIALTPTATQTGGAETCSLKPAHLGRPGVAVNYLDSCYQTNDSQVSVHVQALDSHNRTDWQATTGTHDWSAGLLYGSGTAARVALVSYDSSTSALTLAVYRGSDGRLSWKRVLDPSAFGAVAAGLGTGPAVPGFDGLLRNSAHGWDFLVDAHDATLPTVSAVTPYRVQAYIIDGSNGALRALGTAQTSIDVPPVVAPAPPLNGGLSDDVALMLGTGSGTGQLVGVDSASGSTLWTSSSRPVGATSFFSYGAGPSPALFFTRAGDNDGPGVAVSTGTPAETTSKINLKNGSAFWTEPAIAAINVHPQVTAVLETYVRSASSYDQAVVAISDTGKHLWSTALQHFTIGSDIYVIADPIFSAGDVQHDGWIDVYSDWAPSGAYHSAVTDGRTGHLLRTDPYLIPLGFSLAGQRGSAFAIARTVSSSLLVGIRTGAGFTTQWQHALGLAGSELFYEANGLAATSTHDAPLVLYGTVATKTGARHYTVYDARTGRIIASLHI